MTTTTLSPRDLAIDHELAQVSQSYRFLLDITPVDVEDQRVEFLRGAITEPAFSYRPLEDDPDVMDAMLAAVDVGDVEDATLGHLLRAKHRELALQLDMLRARDTADFLPLSIELYGTVSPALLARAEAILDQIEVPARSRDDHVDAARFAELAEVELAHYRAIDADIGVHVEIRPDATGVMVSGCDLIVGQTTDVYSHRVHALLQHEVGTHLVTYVNGTYQPIRVMAAGLAGYEETQEGLAVLAEYLVGGLSAFRLRQLAARVVAVHGTVAGRSFAEVHHDLVDAGFSASSAFTTTMRVFRSGGLTKDAVYLRGLVDLLGHLGEGGDLDLLWLGKVSLDTLPLVAELFERGVLVEPKLLPRYLHDPAATVRLGRAATLTDVVDLIERKP
jgi:uncharacterized protein (TIGR02421 family)